MPTYTYACNTCDAILETRQSYSDAPLTTCEACGGNLRRVIHPVGIVFKGSGWYVTDSRPSAAAATKSEPATTADKPGTGSSDSGGDKADKSTSKPDGTPPAPAAAPAPSAASPAKPGPKSTGAGGEGKG